MKGTGTTAYAWFVWDKDAPGRTELKWLRPATELDIPRRRLIFNHYAVTPPLYNTVRF